MRARLAGWHRTWARWKIIITGPVGQVIAVTRVRRPHARTPAGEETPGGDGTSAGEQAAGAPGLIGQVTLTIPGTLALAGPDAWPSPATPGAAGPGAATPGASGLGGRLSADGPAAAGLGAPGPGTGWGAGWLGGMLAATLRAARRAAERAADTPPAGGGRCAHQGTVAGYRVPGSLRDLIDARDQGCRNPICRQPASKCDADHTIPWDKGGLTCSCDLSDECRRHHKLKQLRRWQLRQPRPGHLIWATPARLTYASTPPPHPA